jgi:hypothetical protein
MDRFRKCLSSQKKAGAFERVRLAQRAIKDLGEKNLKLTCSVGPSFLKLPDSPELILKFCPPAFLGGELKQRGLPLLAPCCQGNAGIRPAFPRERRTAVQTSKTIWLRLALVKLSSAEAGQSQGQEGASFLRSENRMMLRVFTAGPGLKQNKRRRVNPAELTRKRERKGL